MQTAAAAVADTGSALPFELLDLRNLTADDVPDVVDTFGVSRAPAVADGVPEDHADAPPAPCSWSNMRDVLGARGVQQVLLSACKKGQLDTVRALVEHGVCAPEDLRVEEDYPFRLACGRGHWDVAQFLAVVVGGVDTHARAGDAFRSACMQGRLDMAQWLHGVVPPGTDLGYVMVGFQAACHWGRLETAQWVWSLLAGSRDAGVLVSEGHLGSVCMAAELPMAQWMASLVPPAVMTAACPDLLESVCQRLRRCYNGLQEEVRCAQSADGGDGYDALVRNIIERAALIQDYFAVLKWLLSFGTGWPTSVDPAVRAAYDSWEG